MTSAHVSIKSAATSMSNMSVAHVSIKSAATSTSDMTPTHVSVKSAAASTTNNDLDAKTTTGAHVTAEVKRARSAKRSSAIVIDLDETLLYSTTRQIGDRQPDYYYGDMLGYHRPGAADFLRFCRVQFDYLIVFTAGAPQYAQAMVESLRRRSGVRFDFVFDREACAEETENTGFLEYYCRHVKHLSSLRTMLLPKDVATRIDWDDTLLIDDLAHNARENLQHVVIVPKFSRYATESVDKDDWLPRLQRFLDAKPAGARWKDVERTFWFLY